MSLPVAPTTSAAVYPGREERALCTRCETTVYVDQLQRHLAEGTELACPECGATWTSVIRDSVSICQGCRGLYVWSPCPPYCRLGCKRQHVGRPMADPMGTSLQDRVQWLIDQRGWSWYELAHAMGKHGAKTASMLSMLYRWKNSDKPIAWRQFNVSTLVSLAQTLNVSTDFLLGLSAVDRPLMPR